MLYNRPALVSGNSTTPWSIFHGGYRFPTGVIVAKVISSLRDDYSLIS